MGRTYDVKPKGPGERVGRGLAVTHRGRKIKFVTRVEFDDDADSGPATVTAFVADAGGAVIVGLDRQPVVVTYRADVAVAGSFVLPEESVAEVVALGPPDFPATGIDYTQHPTDAAGRFVTVDETRRAMMRGGAYAAPDEQLGRVLADVEKGVADLLDPTPTVVVGGR